MSTERLLMNSKRMLAEEGLKKLSSELDIHFDNPFLLMRTGLVAKLFFLKEIYEEIIDIPGSIFEVGSWFGQSSIIFENIRAILEPFNNTRNIVSFDTFEGYVETTGLNISKAEIDKYQVSKNWVEQLSAVQLMHKDINNSVTNFKNIKGDILTTLPEYLKTNNEPIAMVYYDIATYDTLKFTFETLLPHIVKGGIFILDDYGHQYEGVNRYLIESKIIKNYKLRCSKFYKSKLILKIE